MPNDTIPLPPLPEPGLVVTRDSLRRQGDWYGPDQLRARDLEVARVVLEAAAFHLRGADKHLTDLQISDQIRALEFKHHE